MKIKSSSTFDRQYDISGKIPDSDFNLEIVYLN